MTQQIVDSLGHVIELEGEQTEILKQLAQSLKGGVGAPSDPKGNPVVEQLLSMTKDTEKRNKEI